MLIRMFTAMCVGLALLLLSTSTNAGMNASAIARLAWEDSSGHRSDSTTTLGGLPRLVLTVKGLRNIKAVDVQLFIEPCGHGDVPAAWYGNGTGGCNDGKWTFLTGGDGTAYTNLFTTAPAVPNVSVSSSQEYVDTRECGSPTKTGFLWLAADGTGGAVRDTAVEYGLWTIEFDVRGSSMGGTTDCAGDLSSGATEGVLVAACSRYPCSSSQYIGNALVVVDSTGSADHIPVIIGSGVGYLKWYEEGCLPWPGEGLCNLYDSVKDATWGRLRRIYR